MIRKLLALVLLLAPVAAQADWYEASTPHFIVYADRNPDRLKEFAEQLERFDKGLRKLQQVSDPELSPSNRLTVYVVGDTDDVEDLARIRNAAGFYVPRAGGSLAIVPKVSGEGYVLDIQPMQILLHEYAHHFMWSIAPDSAYPAWFVEGFAEFNATATFGKDGSITFGEPAMYRGIGLMRGNALPMEKLLTADTRKLKPDQIEGLYGRGWLLTHYLRIGSPERNNQLRAYITAINAGKPPLEAAAAFGDLRQLDKELERYKMGRFKIVKLTGNDLAVGPVAIRKLTPGEAATMKVRIRSKVGVNDKTAPDVYADAKRAAAPYPDDPGAQLELAEAAYDAHDYAAAEAAADRVIAADPKRVRGYVYKAMARMAVAAQAKDKSPATWNAIRRIIATGQRIDTKDPLPLILYYRSFVDPGFPPSEAAKDALYDAFVYAPQDSGLRFNTAAMLLRSGDAAKARALLAPLAFQPHGRGWAERAASLLAKIDAGDTAGAIAELDGAAKTDAGAGGDGG